jgi:hypothetical protein
MSVAFKSPGISSRLVLRPTRSERGYPWKLDRFDVYLLEKSTKLLLLRQCITIRNLTMGDLETVATCEKSTYAAKTGEECFVVETNW